jgi:hypothetical protein
MSPGKEDDYMLFGSLASKILKICKIPKRNHRNACAKIFT